MIKWHKNILYYKNKKIDLKVEIMEANYYKDWLVVATPYKLYFLGKDEIILQYPIFSIQIKKEYIIYHNREDDNIYKIVHPYDEEELIFHSPYYKFKYLYKNNLFILSNGKKILLKFQDQYFHLNLTDADNNPEYKIVECSSSELYNTIDSSLDLKINNLSFDKIFNISLYNDYLILRYENTVNYLRMCNDSFIFDDTIYLNENVEIIKNMRLKLSNERYLDFLQINSCIFFGTKCLCKFNKQNYIDSYREDKYKRNYSRIFWREPDIVEKKILYTMSIEEILKLIVECIETGTYNFNLTGVDRYKINLILEEEYLKSENLKIFLSKMSQYKILTSMEFYKKIQKLYMINTKFMDTKSLIELLNINYQRLFYYNENLNYLHGSKNLAYKIIFYESNREKLFKELRKCAFSSFYKKYFGDERMDEVYKLFNEPIRIFELDENDVEDKKERNYVIRLAANIGKSYCFYNNNFKLKFNKDNDADNLLGSLFFPLIKNGQTTKIDLKNRGWNNWPSFNYGVLKIMSSRKEYNISHILKLDNQDEFLISGIIYGLAVKNKLRGYDFENIKNSVSDKQEVLLAFLLISYGMSNKNLRNSDYEEYCFRQLNIDQSFWIKLGSLIGLSNLLLSTKNIKMRDILIKEINKSGVFQSDKYNKNNSILYDRNYRIINTFNLAKVMNYTNEFIHVNDRLCELILNGICIKDKTKFKRKFERFKGDPLDEIFYSNMFTEECINNTKTEISVLSPKLDHNKSYKESQRFEERLSEIEKEITTFTIWDVYKYAGIIFYYGVSMKLDVTDRHISVLNLIKEEMSKNEGYRILFDYLLITLCIFSNSDCNLDLLKIIRQQIKKTECSTGKNERKNYTFTNSGIKSEIISDLTFGDIEKYKLCLGIISMGLSKYELDKSKNMEPSLISTFYVNWPNAPYEQEFLNIFRFEVFDIMKKKNDIKFKKYFLSRYFKSEFSKLDDKDKKYVIDVLSDYYENYHKEKDYLINVEYFKDFVIRSN
ncbi:hypothetical protein P3W45_000341 [Vairimorpha bombi]|jgi:hypothetical protein